MKSLRERFWSQVHVGGPDECWMWGGDTNSQGYGRLTVGRRKVLAHRLSYAMSQRGEWTGMGLVLHRCDRGLCCNPAHLYLGTFADNKRDHILRGPRTQRLRLYVNEVRAIKEMLRAGINQLLIAELYGVRNTAISAIATGQNWKWCG